MEGEKADFFYVICTGWLKLFHTTEEGEEVILAMLTKNGITGENSIFVSDAIPRAARRWWKMPIY